MVFHWKKWDIKWLSNFTIGKERSVKTVLYTNGKYEINISVECIIALERREYTNEKKKKIYMSNVYQWEDWDITR